MSLTKNLKALSSAAPRVVISWDRAERIRRNKEIWDNKESIVHRLPMHYQKRYWENILTEAAPVHYRPPTSRYSWDPKRLVMQENEVYPIIGFHPPEADEGLWGGETVVKGYIESRPYTKKKLPRHWVPHLWFPSLKQAVFYSEILDRYMKITVTERACRLIDKHFGIDFYLLETPEIDIASKLGNKLKRALLIALAKEEYYPDDEERHAYIRDKYAKFKIPLEEAEWVGLDLNEACRKLQDIEDSTPAEPLKYQFEQELVEKLRKGEDVVTNEEQFLPKKSESLFGERLLGKYLNPIAGRFQRAST
ncbi:39S ribosomal protein L28, mitochondrial [Toxocara canis]|uniref:Large ribosomal subunit protein bL28m n=1 Tax=Toxocara canis TaxID=6265 RepID=A0A0B2UVV8_TOXCA|nr:39S ribosomal protein L28, mitochondrial [Toxocara canis]